MSLNNNQKRELARAFVQHPQHYYRKDNIYDSHLCRFKDDDHDVLVVVKSVDGRGKRPCIGFYFQSPSKNKCLNGLKEETLPNGFYLDERNVTGKPKGWVPFCKSGCNTADEMYRQIVLPNIASQDWKRMFEWVMAVGRKHFGCTEEYFKQEN